MPIRQDDNQPNKRFGIVNIILIGVGALLLFSSLFPNQNMQIPRVPYSLFIDQVNDGEVKRAYISQASVVSNDLTKKPPQLRQKPPKRRSK